MESVIIEMSTLLPSEVEAGWCGKFRTRVSLKPGQKGDLSLWEIVFIIFPQQPLMSLEVLQKAGAEITNYHGCGMSVMEMSHRRHSYIFDQAQAPPSDEILFLQGGASTQFSAIPMNLIGKTGKADYAVTGNFSNIAYEEAQKYGKINLAASSADRNHTYIPTQSELKLDPEASYFYYCANNTIYGTEWHIISLKPVTCPWCAICPRTLPAVWWMCPNMASSTQALRRTWRLPV